MSYKLATYVRTHRKGRALTQAELSELLGSIGPNEISRIENNKRQPTVKTLIGYCIIFGESPAALFPALFGPIEERVIGNLYRRYEQLTNNQTPRGKRQREAIEAALHRATITRRANQAEVCSAGD